MIEKTIGVPVLLLDLVRYYILKENIECPQLIDQINTLMQHERIAITEWWSILQNLYDTKPTPVLGHYIGQLVQPHHIHILGYIALSSPDLKSFLNSFYLYQPLMQNFSKFTYEVTTDELILKWTPVVGKNTQLSNEVLVSGLLSILKKILLKEDIKPLSLAFAADAPPYAEDVSKIYDCPVKFSWSALEIHFSKDLLDAQIPTHDEHLQHILKQQASAIVKAIPHPDPFLVRLKDLILKQLNNGEPTAETIAEQMELPLRSFYRKLQQLDIQFSDVLKNMRHELAKHYLLDTQLSLVEIAFLLGYAEQSAFSRAFKTWEKTTPSTFRKQHQPNSTQA